MLVPMVWPFVPDKRDKTDHISTHFQKLGKLRCTTFSFAPACYPYASEREELLNPGRVGVPILTNGLGKLIYPCLNKRNTCTATTITRKVL